MTRNEFFKRIRNIFLTDPARLVAFAPKSASQAISPGFPSRKGMVAGLIAFRTDLEAWVAGSLISEAQGAERLL